MSFIIYSKPACPQCDQAKMLLKMKGEDFTVKVLNTDFTVEELKEIAPGVKTFPIVFKDEKLLGGLVELKKSF